MVKLMGKIWIFLHLW